MKVKSCSALHKQKRCDWLKIARKTEFSIVIISLIPSGINLVK